MAPFKLTDYRMNHLCCFVPYAKITFAKKTQVSQDISNLISTLLSATFIMNND